MKNFQNKSIGEIVAEDYSTISVFKKNGIDFCCNGNKSISDVCIDKQIDPDKLLHEIESVKQHIHEKIPDFQSWPLDLLTDYIEKKHHRYVEEKIPLLRQYLEKIVQVHGDRHPELLEILKHFNASAGDLTAHMKKEEFMLFPFIRKMVQSQQRGAQLAQPHFGTVQNPIQMMMQEHDMEGGRFGEISNLSNNYLPPEDACNTYKITFASLREFEDDLHLHIHLENNILFPKAIELEKMLANG